MEKVLNEKKETKLFDVNLYKDGQSANDYKQLCSEANEMSKLIRRQMGDD